MEFVADNIAELRPDTDPRSVARILGRRSPDRIQFSVPLPDPLLDAAADALRAFPSIGLRVYSGTVDPSLNWLERFASVEDLTLQLPLATSFDVLRSFGCLRKLGLGATRSRATSLAFLGDLPQIEELWIDSLDRDFAAVGEITALRQLRLPTPRVKSLAALAGHETLETVEMTFGGIRDLAPLATLRRLRALSLYQVRMLSTDDLTPIGECRSLVALNLGALRNVASLEALTRGPAATLRFLTLERMMGLATLADLSRCDALEQFYLVESKPADGRLDLAVRGRMLKHVVVGDHYPKPQLEATDRAFRGETLWVRGTSLRGDPDREGVVVSWRRPVARYLADVDGSSRTDAG